MRRTTMPDCVRNAFANQLLDFERQLLCDHDELSLAIEGDRHGPPGFNLCNQPFKVLKKIAEFSGWIGLTQLSNQPSHIRMLPVERLAD